VFLATLPARSSEAVTCGGISSTASARMNGLNDSTLAQMVFVAKFGACGPVRIV
jgi:hypothetical protein